MQLLFRDYASAHELDDRLGRLTIPDAWGQLAWLSAREEVVLTITSDDEELIVLGDIVSDNIWVRCHNLLLRGKIGTFLEFEVTNGTRQCQVAIDSAEVDESAGSTDSGFLALEGVSKQSLANIVMDIPSFWGL